MSESTTSTPAPTPTPETFTTPLSECNSVLDIITKVISDSVTDTTLTPEEHDLRVMVADFMNPWIKYIRQAQAINDSTETGKDARNTLLEQVRVTIARVLGHHAALADNVGKVVFEAGVEALDVAANFREMTNALLSVASGELKVNELPSDGSFEIQGNETVN